MPTWKGKGNIVHFAANKNHVGYYVGEEAVERFRDRLSGLETAEGTIKLKPDEEVDLALVSESPVGAIRRTRGKRGNKKRQRKLAFLIIPPP